MIYYNETLADKEGLRQLFWFISFHESSAVALSAKLVVPIASRTWRTVKVDGHRYVKPSPSATTFPALVQIPTPNWWTYRKPKLFSSLNSMPYYITTLHWNATLLCWAGKVSLIFSKKTLIDKITIWHGFLPHHYNYLSCKTVAWESSQTPLRSSGMPLSNDISRRTLG